MINGRRASSISLLNTPQIRRAVHSPRRRRVCKTARLDVDARRAKVAQFNLILNEKDARSSLLHRSGNDGSISDRHRGLCGDPPNALQQRGRLRGQEVKSSKRRHKEGKFEKKKKKKKSLRGSSASCVKSGPLPKETRIPIVTAESSVVTATFRKLQSGRRRKHSNYC